MSENIEWQGIAQWVSTFPQYTIDPLFSFSISISAHANFGKSYNKMHKSSSFYVADAIKFSLKST